MGVKDMMARRKAKMDPNSTEASAAPTLRGSTDNGVNEKGIHNDESPMPFLTARTFFMAVLVSMGGIVFGFDTGQISGFLNMDNFKENFGQKQSDGSYAFGNVREGLIVGLVCIHAPWHTEYLH